MEENRKIKLPFTKIGELREEQAILLGKRGSVRIKDYLELIKMIYTSKYLSRDFKKAPEYEFRRQVWTDATYLLIIT